MEITEVKIFLRNEDKLRAFVNVTFDNCFVVRGLKVINGPEGFFVSMPSRKVEDGTFRDITHPITREFRDKLEKIILEKYREEAAHEGAFVTRPIEYPSR